MKRTATVYSLLFFDVLLFDYYYSETAAEDGLSGLFLPEPRLLLVLIGGGGPAIHPTYT